MTTAALALEQLMTHPRYPELAAKLRALLPAHIVDQADAAVDETTLFTKALSVLLDARSGAVRPEDLPGWLRLGLLQAWVGFASGQASTCRHSPTASSPQPVFAAAWKPDLVTCGNCVFLFSLRGDSDADATCDSCGHCCAGPAVDDGVYPAMIQLGPLVYQYGTCRDCTPSTTGAANPPAAPHDREASRVRPRGRRGHRRGRGR